jgi:hypothetical protein
MQVSLNTSTGIPQSLFFFAENLKLTRLDNEVIFNPVEVVPRGLFL